MPSQPQYWRRSRVHARWADAQVPGVSPQPSPSQMPDSHSAEAWLEYWRRFYGPTMKSFEAVGEAGRAALEADLLELVARFNRAGDGTMVVPSEYLEAVVIKR